MTQPGNEDRHTNTPHDAATDAQHHSDENWDNDTPTRQEIRDEAVENDE